MPGAWLRHDFTHDEYLSDANAGSLILRRFQFGLGIFQSRGNALAVGLLRVNFDRDRVNLVRIESFGDR